MMVFRQALLSLTMMAMICMGSGVLALAGPVDPRAVTDGFSPFDSGVAGFASTFDRKVFSSQSAPVAAGPNATVAGIPVAPGLSPAPSGSAASLVSVAACTRR
jgi:hypothetical protein